MKGKMEAKGMMCESCGCPCHKVGCCTKGVGLLLLGLIFLAKNRMWLGASTADTLWPLVLVLAGGMMLAKKMCKCCK